MNKYKISVYRDVGDGKNIPEMFFDEAITLHAKDRTYEILETVSGLEDGEYYAKLYMSKGEGWTPVAGMPTISFRISEGQYYLTVRKIDFCKDIN